MTRDVIPVWPGQQVRAGDTSVHVRRVPAGQVGREPAVMVHGLGGSATDWTDMMNLLRDRLDAIAPDLPGFGWSPPPPDANYSPEAHARTVAELIDRTVGEPVHLMGNSLGGAVATLVAARRPELVRTLTLVSPALPVYLPRATNVHLPALAFPFVGQRLARRIGRFPVEARVRATLALCFADPTRVPPQRFEEAVAEASRRGRLEYESEAMLATLRALIAAYLRRGPSTLWNAAARVQAPTLLVYGLRDKLVDPKTSARAARTFPRSQLLVLPGSGHVAQMEHPEVVATAVRKFIDRVGSRDIDLRPVSEQQITR
ncbi:MAG: alpha/beta hydrolase [Sporichthyaceae bacterium]